MAGLIRIYRYSTALVALSGIVIAYAAIIPAAHVSRLRMTANFFSYFTIQANILLVLVLLWAETVLRSTIGRWASRSSVRSAVFIYVGVAGAVYAFVLRDEWHPHGWQLRGDLILHYCVPLLYALDWIFLTGHGRLSWRDVIWWLAFPAVYSGYTLVHGYVSRFYPYPFLDVNDIGLEDVLLNMAVLGLTFLLLGGVLVLLDRMAAKLPAFRWTRTSGKATPSPPRELPASD